MSNQTYLPHMFNHNINYFTPVRNQCYQSRGNSTNKRSESSFNKQNSIYIGKQQPHDYKEGKPLKGALSGLQIKLRKLAIQVKDLQYFVLNIKQLFSQLFNVVDWNLAISKNEGKSFIKQLYSSDLLSHENDTPKEKQYPLSNIKNHHQSQHQQRELQRLQLEIKMKEKEINILKREFGSDKHYLEQKVNILTRKIDILSKKDPSELIDNKHLPTNHHEKNTDKIKRGICSHNKLLYNKKVIDSEVTVKKRINDANHAPKFGHLWSNKLKSANKQRNRFQMSNESKESKRSHPRQLKLRSQKTRSLIQKNLKSDKKDREKSLSKIEYDVLKLKSEIKSQYDSIQQQLSQRPKLGDKYSK